MNENIPKFESARDISDNPMLSISIDDVIEPHFHRQIELLYVTEGKIIVTINGEEQVLHADQFSIADSYDIHAYRPVGSGKAVVLIIPQSVLMEYYDLKHGYVLANNFITDAAIAKKCKSLLDVLFEFWDQHQKLNQITSHICQGLLMLIAQSVGFIEKKATTMPGLNASVLKYVLENLYSPSLTLDSISKNFGYDKYYFSKLFLSTFKVSFHDYINTLRAKDAVYLIQVKKYSVLDAALYVGFNSQATFYRFVKQHFKGSPKTVKI
jgi:AraC-like DNA-binding protein